MIVKSSSPQRIQELLGNYVERVQRDFQAYLAPRDKPTA